MKYNELPILNFDRRTYVVHPQRNFNHRYRMTFFIEIMLNFDKKLCVNGK